MTQTTTQKLRNVKKRWFQSETQYYEAWKKLRQASSRVPKLWKTEKTSLQILKEERTT